VNGVKFVGEDWGCDEQGGGERILHWGERKDRRKRRLREKRSVGSLGGEDDDGSRWLWLRVVNRRERYQARQQAPPTSIAKQMSNVKCQAFSSQPRAEGETRPGIDHPRVEREREIR